MKSTIYLKPKINLFWVKNESTPAEKIKVSQPNKIIEKSRLNKFQFRERELNSFCEIVFLAIGSEKCKSFSLKNHSKIADWKLLTKLSHSFNYIFNERFYFSIFTKTNGRTFLQRWNTVINKHQFFWKIPEFANKKNTFKILFKFKE
jgi:hypothetical protein